MLRDAFFPPVKQANKQVSAQITAISVLSHMLYPCI